MKILKRIALGLVAVVILGVGALFISGNGSLLTLGWAFLFGGPSLPFDPVDAVAPPDYADPASWAALPEREGLEDRTPAGVVETVEQGQAPVDVFFIHPTGYLRGSNWTFSMDPDTATEENTHWMMANQASTYNGCCNVYAPRYRQASIFAYFRSPEIREQVLGFAYQDVERAFEYFLTHYSQGRPFIIASHSQGTHHGARLLKDRIDGTPLADRLVAAYLIGGGVPSSEFAGMLDIGLCQDATDLHCAVHWDTYSEAAIDTEMPDRVGNVCINPLSWQIDGGLAGREQHLGAVPVSGRFQIQLTGDNAASGMVFEPLAAPIEHMLQAQCRNGVLFITDQSDTAFGSAGGFFGAGNYHGLDYPVFHMDIRENAKQRVAVYLAAMAEPSQASVVYQCDGGAAESLSVAFSRQTEPASALISFGKTRVTAFIVPSASGARYAAPEVSFWEHQGEAAVEWFGTRMTCRPSLDS